MVDIGALEVLFWQAAQAIRIMKRNLAGHRYDGEEIDDDDQEYYHRRGQEQVEESPKLSRNNDEYCDDDKKERKSKERGNKRRRAINVYTKSYDYPFLADMEDS